MKEEQKVYIRGVGDRGDEVIKTLEDLGGGNPYRYHGDNNNAYYYINPDGEIAYTCADVEFRLLPFLREFYKEIKLPRWKPKYKERYYRINWKGAVVETAWYDTQDEEICYEFGNCFRTKEEAEVARDKIKKMLNK